MAQAFTIDFKLLLGDNEEDWVSVKHLLGEAAYLVDYYLSLDDLYCCCFQGGFFIDIDGQPWSNDGHVDEFRMTATWFPALRELLSGKTQAQAHPWEESRLTLRRVEQALVMEDIHYSGHIAMPKVQVSLYDFVEQMVKTGTLFAQIIKEITHEIQIRRADGVSDEIEAKLQEIERNVPQGLPGELESLSVLLET